jgi:DNA-binding NtrC family response regulator
MLACGGNRTKAAEQLGMSRRSLYNKLKRYGIGNNVGG